MDITRRAAIHDVAHANGDHPLAPAALDLLELHKAAIRQAQQRDRVQSQAELYNLLARIEELLTSETQPRI